MFHGVEAALAHVLVAREKPMLFRLSTSSEESCVARVRVCSA